MGLLPATLPCELPESTVACGQLFDQGERFLEIVLDALEDFVTPDCECEALDGYVSLGPPPIYLGQGELVGVFLVRYGRGEQRRNLNTPADRISTRFTAQWRIQIWESCYPMVEGAEQPIPPALPFAHEIHRHMHAHAVSAYNAMWTTWATEGNEMYPSCESLTFGDLLPLEPQGGYAGFTWDVAGVIGFSEPLAP